MVMEHLSKIQYLGDSMYTCGIQPLSSIRLECMVIRLEYVWNV